MLWFPIKAASMDGSVETVIQERDLSSDCSDLLHKNEKYHLRTKSISLFTRRLLASPTYFLWLGFALASIPMCIWMLRLISFTDLMTYAVMIPDMHQ